MVLNTLFIVVAVCLDSLAIGIAYGIREIKIPKLSLLMIDFVCTIFLFISMFLGGVVKKILPGNIPSIISFLILFSLGLYFILESLMNVLIERQKKSDKKLEIKFSNVKIVIDVIVDCTKADMNNSGDIDIKEAIYLGTALSLDALGIGFGAAMGNINYIQVLIFSFIFNIFAIVLGLYVGGKIVSKTEIDFSWISGAILIFLALCKLN